MDAIGGDGRPFGLSRRMCESASSSSERVNAAGSRCRIECASDLSTKFVAIGCDKRDRSIKNPIEEHQVLVAIVTTQMRRLSRATRRQMHSIWLRVRTGQYRVRTSAEREVMGCRCSTDQAQT